MYITLIPAYGRDYKSKKAVFADWNDGKDFFVNSFGHPHDGRYINKQDAENAGPATYNIRYCKNTKVLPIKVK